MHKLKKGFKLILLLSFSYNLLGQSPFEVVLGTQGGLEYNVFRAGQVLDETDQPSAVRSGYFQHLNIEATWEKKIKKHHFAIEGEVTYDYFPTLRVANVFRPSLRFQYNYKINKQSAVFLDSRVMKYQTFRAINPTEILPVPTAYNKWEGELGYKFRPLKNNKSQLVFSMLEKKFAPTRTRQFQYTAFGWHLVSIQKLKKEGKLKDYFTLDLAVTRRYYTITRVDKATNTLDPNTVEKRLWQYITTEVSYDYALTKDFRIHTGLLFEHRKDISNNKFGYKEWGFFMEWELARGPITIQLQQEVILRTFSTLLASKQHFDVLRHHYFKTDFRIDYAYNEQLDFRFQIELNIRQRNFADTARSFLPYRNGLISFGIVYRFLSP